MNGMLTKEQALALLEKSNQIQAAYAIKEKQDAKAARLAEIKAAKAACKSAK